MDLDYHNSAGLPSCRSLENRSLIDEPFVLKVTIQVPYFFLQPDFLPSEVVTCLMMIPIISYYIRKETRLPF